MPMPTPMPMSMPMPMPTPMSIPMPTPMPTQHKNQFKTWYNHFGLFKLPHFLNYCHINKGHASSCDASVIYARDAACACTCENTPNSTLNKQLKFNCWRCCKGVCMCTCITIDTIKYNICNACRQMRNHLTIKKIYSRVAKGNATREAIAHNMLAHARGNPYSPICSHGCNTPDNHSIHNISYRMPVRLFGIFRSFTLWRNKRT